MLILSRYPDYLNNMLDYTNLPHYHVYFDNKTVYNTSIVMTLPENYTFPKHEEFKRGEDYLVPK